jgi:hypothetical protein
MIHRIIIGIFIDVDSAIIPHRVSLKEPSQRRRVESVLVIIDPQLADPLLPRILEPAAVEAVPSCVGLRDAVFVIFVDAARHQRAAAVGGRDDRALRVGVEQPLGGRGDPGALVLDQRIVGAGAVDVAPQQRTGAVVLRDQVVAVIDQPGGGRARMGRRQPPQGIVGQNRKARTIGRARARADQPVLGVVAIEGAARLGEVAVGIVSEARASRGGVLVESVGRVGPVDARSRRGQA